MISAKEIKLYIVNFKLQTVYCIISFCLILCVINNQHTANQQGLHLLMV